MMIYLDNAATTKLDERVLKKMIAVYHGNYGNASAIHFLGQYADQEIAVAKQGIAKLLHAENGNIIFTASATEANNLAIKGIMRANIKKGKHLIVSAIEHPCILRSAEELEQEGFIVTYLPVKKNGQVDLKILAAAIKSDTVLISIMAVNNETGVVQDIAKIGKLARKHNVIFHCDAVQAVSFLELDMEKMQIDALTLSAHKCYGPQGVGLLWLKEGVKIKPLIVGGGQENNLRSGTYNLAGILGFAEALRIAYLERSKYLKHVSDLSAWFIKKVLEEIPHTKLNPAGAPHIANIMFKGIEGEAILMDLSLKGICVSTGSACSAQNLKASTALSAMGLRDEELNSNIRFSFGKYNTKAELKTALRELRDTVKRLRSFSPLS